MNKHEKKFKNTTDKIYRAFLEILEKKDFDLITVSDICQQAGIARTTFYLHYSNTTELAQEITEAILREFTSTQAPISSVQGTFDSEQLISKETLRPYLEFIRSHQRLYKIFIGNPGLFRLSEHMKLLQKLVFEPIYHKQGTFDDSVIGYYSSFFVAGVASVMMHWVEADCSLSIDTLILIIRACLSHRDDIHE